MLVEASLKMSFLALKSISGLKICKRKNSFEEAEGMSSAVAASAKTRLA